MSAHTENLPNEETSTIFTTLPAQFPIITHNEKIRTEEFLNASTAVVVLVEKFGKVFSPVIYDLNGNIKTLTDKYKEDKENHIFMEDMILRAKGGGELVVISALQWLRRGLHFITRFFESIIEDSVNETQQQNLGPLVKHAYDKTLARYHGWLGTQIFNILTRFIPNRHHLIYVFALERHNKDEYVLRDMKIFTEKMSICIEKLVVFYEEHNLETHERV